MELERKTTLADLEKICKDNNISVECVSVKKMASLLNVTATTVISYMKDGKLNYTKTVGGHRRIPVTEAEKFINKNFNIGNNKVEKIEQKSLPDKKDDKIPVKQVKKEAVKKSPSKPVKKVAKKQQKNDTKVQLVKQPEKQEHQLKKQEEKK